MSEITGIEILFNKKIDGERFDAIDPFIEMKLEGDEIIIYNNLHGYNYKIDDIDFLKFYKITGE